MTDGHPKVSSLRQIVLLSFFLCLSGTRVIVGQAQNLACGPPKEKTKVVLHKGEHPLPEPPAGKALIYVIRVRKYPDKYPSQGLRGQIGIAGQWVGGTLPGTYFYAPVEPGLVILCSAWQTSSWNLLAITAEAGKVYYLQQWGYAHKWIAVSPDDFGVKQLSEKEAKPLLESVEYATLEKGK
jgi:hypothetical protein